MRNVSHKFEMMKTDKTGQDRQADFERLAMQGRSNFSFTLGRILDTVDIWEKQARTHARTHANNREGQKRRHLHHRSWRCLLACCQSCWRLSPQLWRRKHDLMMCMYASRRRLLWNARQSTSSPRSVGRSVVEMAERRRGCKRCLVQETLGICARFHYCLRLAPSTTSDNHLPQQQRNKETTRAFLPSFLRFHTLSFVSATSQKKLQP